MFCPNCNNLYDITNINPSQLLSDETETSTSEIDYAEIINNLLKNVDVDQKINLNNLTSHQEYKKLSAKQKETINKKLEKNVNASHGNLVPSYFCTTCGNYEAIKIGSVILDRSICKDNNFDLEKSDEILNDKTLPISRNYICPNNNCESHKDHSKRAAKFNRIEKGKYRLIYVCCACKSSWTT